jgi:hypothetical protein
VVPALAQDGPKHYPQLLAEAEGEGKFPSSILLLLLIHSLSIEVFYIDRSISNIQNVRRRMFTGVLVAAFCPSREHLAYD